MTESAQQVSQLSTHCKVLARGLDRAMPNIRTSPRQVLYLVHACAAGPLAFWYEFANARSVASEVSAHQGDWRLFMINSNAICSTFCTPFKIHTKIHIEFCESYCRPFEEYSVGPNLYLPLAAQLHTQSTLFSTRAHALRGVLLLRVTLNRRPRCLTFNALLPSNLVPVFHRIRHPFWVEIGTRFSPKMVPVFLQFWYPFFANSGTRFSKKLVPISGIMLGVL